MQKNIDVLRQEMIEKNTVIAGLVLRCPVQVLDEVRQLLRQSKNTKIHYCVASTEPRTIIHVDCSDKKAVILDAGNGEMR
jgi:hypothetical protein